MPTEYQSLFILTIFLALAWLPASFAKFEAFGLPWLAGNRDRPHQGSLALWGGRADRAHQNLKDYYPSFAVTILLLGVLNGFNQTTACAAAVFLLARLLHLPFYCLGWARMRFLSFAVSFVAQILLWIQLAWAF